MREKLQQKHLGVKFHINQFWVSKLILAEIRNIGKAYGPIFFKRLLRTCRRGWPYQYKGNCKGNAIPLQYWTDPEGPRGLRLPDFKIIGT
jgi:hypothetical protein